MSGSKPSEYTGAEIAIVGMAGRFPGARNLDEFWRNLRDGVESIRPLSLEELDAAGVPRALSEHPDYVRMAAVLDDVDQWDAGFFGFSPKDAAIMDPQHRLFLECSWEALENAGHVPERFPGAIGVWAGCGMNSYFTWHLAGNRPLMDEVGLFLVRHTGNDKDFLATRVSYTFDLRGPSVNVQTACSTSLVAIHQACQALLSGEVDMALAGGVTIELPQKVGYLYKESEILSPDGHCRAFAADSKGTIFGSGAGVVVLRRLSDALESGDHIHAIVRGSAINNDGSQKVGYLAPSVDGQAAAVAEALAIAGVEASSMSYVEMHGTGTPVGDPIEVTALTQAFRQGTDERQFCAIGSLKSNIGHLDTAAGVAGLIKAVLAMQHGEIPASLHFDRPNPAIDFASSPFYVNATRSSWAPRDGVRRAGVSSLGVGGTNAHVVLEEAPAVERAAQAPDANGRWELLPLSARSGPALDAASDRLADLLERADPPALGDAAHTLQRGRRAFRQRRVVVARDAAEAVRELAVTGPEAITGTASDSPRPVAFMFAGGGAQYPGMGAELYETQRVYRESVDESLSLLDPALAAALRPLLFPAPGTEAAAAAQLERPSLALPALLLTQVATAALWRSWGVEPDAMIGHSMGEYTAAYLAGVFSLKDALALVALRGRLFERIEASGMLSVPLAEDELRPLLGTDLSLAAVNAPGLCVASGPLWAIDALEKKLLARDIECQRVRINIAAHSMMLDPILDSFRAFFDRVRLSPPTMRFASNLSGTWITAEEATNPDYWVHHLRNTVRFADGLRELLREPNRALIEVGPGRVMSSLARQNSDLQPTQVVSTTMRHATDKASDTATALRLLGRLWCAGVEVNWEALHEGVSRRRVQLPTYPFERQRHWIDRVGAAGEHAAAAVVDASTEARQALDAWFSTPTWRADGVRPAAAGSQRVVLLGGDEPLGRALGDALRAAGHDVTVVREGRRFEERDGGFVLAPAAREGYDALLKALAAGGRAPTQIVHLWTLPAIADAAAGEQLAFRSVLHLAQAMADAELADVRLTIVASGAQQVADEDVEPLKALALGAARVIPRELPGVRVRHVDVRPAAAGSWQEARLVEQLVAELADAGDAECVALRGGDRLVQEFAPASLDDAATRGTLLRDEGVYLVTGGLGGIGLSLAEHLARRVRAKLVLVGRSGLPPRERWDAQVPGPDGDAVAERIRKVRALEALGAEVLVVKADVTDAAQIARAVAEARARFGALHGVLHAAGVLDDQLLQMKTAEAAERVLAPKVRGTLALDAALGDEPVDFVALCSSVSAIAGLPGQVDYAAANAFLDAFARARNVRRPGRTIAIGWSAWAGVGMVATLAREEHGPSGPGEATGHPFLEHRWNGTPSRLLLGGTVSATQHWILDEHRLDDGAAVIPGTGYVELARAALAGHPGEGVLEMRDLVFMTPLLVRDAEARDLRVGVTHAGDESAFVIGSAPAGAHAGWIEHARGTGAWVVAEAPAALDLAEIARRATRRVVRRGEVVPQTHLRFGARWDVIEQVAYGDGEALLALTLPAPFAADLESVTLHPALMDLATAGAQALVEGYDPREHFFVPVSYTRLRQHGALPREIRSHVRLREAATIEAEFVAFDVTVTDASGRVLVDVEEFMMKRVGAAELQASAAHAASVGAVPEWAWVRVGTQEGGANTSAVAEAIQPEEGAEVFDRMTARGTPAHVLVSPRPLAAAIERLRGAAVAPAAPAAAPAAQEPPVDVARVEAALEEHDAVEAAGVIAHRTRKGEVKIAAFVQFHPGESATVSELRRFARGRLPDTLVPQTFEEVVELPRTADGAVDHGALPDPFAAADDFVAPSTPMQVAIAQVWREVLGVDRVSLRDNFFDIGGHSLLAMRVITRLNKTIGVRIDTPMMVLQTLEQIASECEKRGGTVPGGDAAPAAAPAAAAAATPTRAAESAQDVVAAAAAPADGGADEQDEGGVDAPDGIGRRLFGAFKQKVFSN